MKYGFILKGIVLTGPEKKAAEVTFTHGLNIVAGPSDTGKSFIAQCIDYALGGGDPPKDIPEAEGYNLVCLEIESYSDHCIYRLERSLHGGDILCKTVGQPNRILAAKHQSGNENTVSQFLLNLSGLGNKKVRTNQRGKTRSLSFRDIARLVIVDEETVIKETSPVLSGQVVSETAESGIFRLLLTGTDDSSIIEKEDIKIEKGKKAGKIELLDDLLKNTRERLTEYSQVGSLIEERDRLSKIEDVIRNAIVERNSAQAKMAPLESKRNRTWVTLRTVESKLAVSMELQTRFNLLNEQYSSDLRRLETISEASVLLDQLKEERCPLCGALAEYHDLLHRDTYTSLADIALASNAEAIKTNKLLQDLQATMTSVTTEIKQFQDARSTYQESLNAITTELKNFLEQHVNVAIKKVDDLRASAEECRKAIEILERVQELEILLDEAKMPQKGVKSDIMSATVSSAQADPFSNEVEALLKDWHFPNLSRVTFSQDDQDLVISGRTRKSHGKGVRAIIRAAFNLALLKLCVEEERPFPNFVLIDSPLLVYEEPDVDETSFPQDIKKQFWENVKKTFSSVQVIIIENSRQIPSADNVNDVNVIRFTGNDQGRYGFIPKAQE
jgi:chromosome segregation ATPase